MKPILKFPRSRLRRGTPKIPIIVGAKAVSSWREDPYALTQSVVDFANIMTIQGYYEQNEIPEEVGQAFHCDYYLAQVSNGGHRQFFHNNKGGKACIDDVIAGLTAMGAIAHLDIFAQAVRVIQSLDSVEVHYDAVPSKQKSELDTLNKEFFAVNREASLHEALARWIASWPNLKLVEDAEIQSAYTELAHKNPHRSGRIEARGYATVCGALSDRATFALRYAAVSIKPEPEFPLSVGVGMYVQIEGKSRTVFSIQTNAARRLCAIDQFGVEFFSAEGHPVGDRLSSFSNAQIKEGIALCEKCDAGPALALLLKRSGLDPSQATICYAGVFSEGTKKCVTLYIIGYELPLICMVFLKKKFAILSSTGTEKIFSKVTGSEVTSYKRKIAGAR